MSVGRFRIGTSGYEYPHWKGLFYPEGLPRRNWFAVYARHFDTVEINNSFYRLPEARTFAAWRAQAPVGFLYAVKYSRFGTHMKKLKEPETHLRRFLEHVGSLGNCLGPVLVQLPPHWGADRKRLAAFLTAAPRHIRWAVEFRDPSWLRDEIFNVLREHGAALCLHDRLPDHPWVLTTDWTYVRFHGAGPDGDYRPELLRDYARRLHECLEQGDDVYAYFNNDWHGHALHNALDLRRQVRQLRGVEIPKLVEIADTAEFKEAA